MTQDMRDNDQHSHDDGMIAPPSVEQPADPFNLTLASRAKMEALGRAIGRLLKGGEVLALIGTLGAGKTTLVRGIATGLGVPSHSPSSPTFVLAQEYQGRVPLIHIDLYRLKDWIEADSSGLSDCFAQKAVVAIEWADRFPAWLPLDRLEIRLAHHDPTTRDVTLMATGPASCLLLARIKHSQHTPLPATTSTIRRTRGKAFSQ